MVDQNMLRETRDRTRRIETRLTSLLVRLGDNVQAQKPRFEAGSVRGNATLSLPSPHSSMQEVLDSIPQSCQDDIDVMLGGRYLVTIKRAGSSQ